MLQGNLVSITAQQVLVMFLLILVGYLAVRFHILDAGARRSFSSLLVNIVVPAMIVNSYMTAFDPEILANLVRTALVSLGVLVAGLAVALAFTCRMRHPDRPLIRFCHHLFQRGPIWGSPSSEALFGAEGLLYASIFNTFFNILIWTAGMAILDPKASQGNPPAGTGQKAGPSGGGSGPGALSGSDPGPRPDCPAHQPAGGHEYPPVHADHRRHHRHQRPARGHTQRQAVADPRSADGGHPRRVLFALHGHRHRRDGGARW